jgi:phosphoglycolate phosphatase
MLQKKLMIKLIIFDLDGTLVDSGLDINNALNYAVAPYGLEKLTLEQTISMVGEGLSRLIEKVLGKDRADILPEVSERFVKYYSEHLADFTLPYPGVTETLQRLSDYRKAVISNKREALSKELLEALGLSGYFDIILGSDSVEEKKPSPKPVLQVLRRFSLSPEEAVMVGDSNFDIEAGKAAGVVTIAVSYGFRPPEFLKGADFLIDSMGGLIKILEGLNAVRKSC